MTGGEEMIAGDQYLALRDGRAFVALVGWSSVTVTGADRQIFLHNFCTNDIRGLVPGKSCEAFFTSVKGKILGHGLVSCREDELVIITVPGQGPVLMAHLDRYVIREDVAVRDSMAERSYLLLSDSGLMDELLPALPQMRWDLIGRPTSELVEVPTGELTALRKALLEQKATKCDLAAFETLRIEAGVPLFGVDFSEDNLPQEVSRDKLAISFTKGCYLGQETVARIDALGHVNQQVGGVQFAGTEVPRSGMELTRAGHVTGHVTSATFSPRLNAPLALSMLRRDSISPGSELESAAGAARVISLPCSDR